MREEGVPLLEALARAQAHPKILDLVNVHSGRFDHRALKIDPDEGYFSKDNITSSPHLFFSYQVFLFQVVPSKSYKRRRSNLYHSLQ